MSNEPKTNLPIIFARTRHIYDSYTDFWKLVELSGYETCYVDEINMSRSTIYITAPVNGDFRAHMENHKEDFPRNAHIIAWVLERPGSEDASVSTFGKINRQLMSDRLVDEVWVSDRRMADETSLRYVTLGSNYGLGEPGNKKIFDFCHMSYMTPRRQTIYKHFMNIGPNCWKEERHQVLQQSFFALNVHQDNFPFCEPLRLALFAAYGLPVVSEYIYDTHPYGEDLTMCSYDDLVKVVQLKIRSGVTDMKEQGERFRKKMCEEFEFKKMVDEAIYINGLHWR